MDEAYQPADRSPLPLQGPHWHRGPGPELPPDFFPLRLVLQPDGYSVDLTRPEMMIGRHSEADVRLPLPDVSRRHCRFVFAAGRWQVYDLNSLNGVFVNGERVQQATLEHGDQVRIGGFTFEADLGAVAGKTLDMTGSQAGVLRSIVEVLPPQEKRKAS